MKIILFLHLFRVMLRCRALLVSVWMKKTQSWSGKKGQILTADDIYDSSEIYIQNDHGNDYHKPGFETSNSIDGYPDEYPPYFHDEIVEYLCYSDAASLPDSGLHIHTDRNKEGISQASVQKACYGQGKGCNGSGPCDEVVKENSTMEDDKQSEVLSELIEEITEAHDEDNDSCSDKTESNESDDNDVIGEIRQENSADILPKNENFQTSCERKEFAWPIIDDQDGSDQSEENDSSEKQRSGLRHQEMDERRNAEEWMLDHALQKTVNQLTPARKKKVALLVEAFETVVPV
ncbi:Calmodulin binding protein PICBP [Bienertia sinuspersici]